MKFVVHRLGLSGGYGAEVGFDYFGYFIEDFIGVGRFFCHGKCRIAVVSLSGNGGEEGARLRPAPTLDSRMRGEKGRAQPLATQIKPFAAQDRPFAAQDRQAAPSRCKS